MHSFIILFISLISVLNHCHADIVYYIPLYDCRNYTFTEYYSNMTEYKCETQDGCFSGTTSVCFVRGCDGEDYIYRFIDSQQCEELEESCDGDSRDYFNINYCDYDKDKTDKEIIVNFYKRRQRGKGLQMLLYLWLGLLGSIPVCGIIGCISCGISDCQRERQRIERLNRRNVNKVNTPPTNIVISTELSTDNSNINKTNDEDNIPVNSAC